MDTRGSTRGGSSVRRQSPIPVPLRFRGPAYVLTSVMCGGMAAGASAALSTGHPWTALGSAAGACRIGLPYNSRYGRYHRQRAWLAAGRCPGCGYDLRTSADACPECGRAINPA